jgi:hypothetical protein
VFAFGQLATGVVAVGQVSRGGIAVGQLAFGLVSVGMVAVGVLWTAGIGLAGVGGPGLVIGLFGHLRNGRLHGTWRSGPWDRVPIAPWRLLVATAGTAALGGLWWIWVGRALTMVLH